MRVSALSKYAKEHGKSPVQVLKELYDEHSNQTVVAAKLGISQARLSQYLREYNLEQKLILVERAS